MTKRTKKPTRRASPKPARDITPNRESSAAEAATVAWTLAFMAASLADLAALALWLLGRFWPGAENQADATWLFMPILALFIAAVSGLVCLILTPVVYRVRRASPPPSITLFAVVSSGIPLGILLALFAR